MTEHGDDDPGFPRVPVRARRSVGAVLVILLAAGAIAVAVTAFSPRGGERPLAPAPTASSDAREVTVTEPAVFVHVLGQVRRPGLFELRDGARVVDAVSAAGGFTEQAERGGVNLARLLVDGEQLRVPAIGEQPPPDAADGAGAADGILDLNTATVADLDTLPRIGPAIAQRIVDWRDQNGPIRSVDDLLAISGIGSKTVEALRPLVRP